MEARQISHRDFVAQVQGAAGVHGYCGGLPAAIAIACAWDESELVSYVATALKILVGIGAYTEAADDDKGAERTLLAVRLKHEGQGDDLIRRFPGAYISGITGPRSISIGGPAATTRELFRYITEEEGLRAERIDLGGSAHNPKNAALAAELCRLCRNTPGLQLPDAEQLHTPVRTNQTGERLFQGSLTDDLIYTMLAARCEWYTLLQNVAQDLKESPRAEHNFAIFGWADCVTMTPFHQAHLKISKTFAKSLIREEVTSPSPDAPSPSPDLPDNAIAVVGASCRLPGAKNMNELWDLLASGTDRVQELSTDRFDLPGSHRASQSGSLAQKRTFYGNFLEGVERFDHGFFGMSAREAANTDPQQRLMLELSHEALEDAGYLASHERAAGDDVGCFVGLVLAEYMDNTNGHAPTAYTSTGTVPAFLCGRISHTYGWSGPSEMFNTACSSSMVAINRACKAVQMGECRMALAGGVNVITGVNNYLDLAKAGFLSPTGQCKPFDASADGYCRAEGAGLVVLKKLQDAIMDGDSIWGVIPGVATNQAGLSSSITVPSPTAQQKLYRKVLQQSGLREDQITYVEAHGTGTQVGDPLEMDSLRSVFGNTSRQNKLHIGSIKGNVGHSEPAAGVAGLLKVLTMLRHGKIPPQANFKILNPKIPSLDRDGIAITRQLIPWRSSFRAALVNSYGAAGSNGALICCSAPQNLAQHAEAGPTRPGSLSYPLIISASCKASLIDTARSLRTYLSQKSGGPSMQIADIAFTLNQKRQRQKYFATLRADSTASAARSLQSLEVSSILEVSTSDKSRPVVLAFSGQTSQTIGLSKSIYDTFPAFRSYVDACDAEFRKLTQYSLLPAVFGSDVIESIPALQCGIFAVQYACARCWLDAGVQPRALIGHSLGELTALVVSGVLSMADGIRLVQARGDMIEKKWGPEKGSMLALECTAEEFADINQLTREKGGAALKQAGGQNQLEIACFNGPASLVVVGPQAEVDNVESILRTEPRFQRIRSQRLKTSHGFHSALIEPILSDLTVTSEPLTWNQPSIPLYTCTESTSVGFDAQYSAAHARQPVFFTNAVRRVEENLDQCVWLEAGFDTPVISMARKACRRPEMHAFRPVKTQSRPFPPDAISEVLTSLYRESIFPAHWKFLGSSQGDERRPAGGLTHEYRQVWLPPYQFTRTRHWVDNVDRVVEMKKLMLEQQSQQPVRATETVREPPLVAQRQASDSRAGYAEFVINPQNPRFRSVVGGHVVCSRALCPAPLYMECTTMALLLLLEDRGTGENRDVTSSSNLMFEDFNVRSPLGLDPRGEVILRLKEVSGRQRTWGLTIISTASSANGILSGETAHADGIISFTADPSMLAGFERLVAGQMRRLASSPGVERLQCDRAYKLFARVVEYDPFFMGMQSVQLDTHEALATVRLPESQPHRDNESAAWKICDAVAIDAVVHVVGLLINTSQLMSSKDVAVMVGIDRAVVSPAFSSGAASDCRVFARFDSADGEQQPIGDVFVCSPMGRLVAMFTGCRMTRLPVVKLERIFDAAFSPARGERRGAAIEPSTDSSNASTSTATGQGVNTPSTRAQSSDRAGTGADSAVSVLRGLVAECTGIDAVDIPEDSPFALMGLDSLGSAELSEELSNRFGLVISSSNLLDSTLAQLRQLVGPQHPDLPSSRPTEIDSHHSHSPALTGEENVDHNLEKLFNLLSEVSDARPEDIEPSTTLADIGIDSLSMIDLKQEIEDGFAINIDLDMSSTVEHIMSRLGIATSRGRDVRQSQANDDAMDSMSRESQQPSVIQTNPFSLLNGMSSDFDSAARTHGVADYWTEVAPFQDELALAYITEGFAGVGVDLSKISPGYPVPSIPYQSPKYDKLVRRLWDILAKREVVWFSQDPDGASQPRLITCGSRQVGTRPASQLLEEFDARFPTYRNETRLIGLTGPRLAECLSGKVDSVSLMFGSPAALKIMEEYYSCSPISSAVIEQLTMFIKSLLSRRKVSDHPVRILEVGGGTGGTTRWLASALEKVRIPSLYTFTDISPSLVRKAKTKFAPQFPWMTFATLDLEADVRPEFRRGFDIAIATNTVHATADRVASCRRLRETLTPAGGLVILAELTCHIDWCDICFGLLDGWWLADGPIAPLQTADEWMGTFAEAGFPSFGYSSGTSPGANTAQLLVGCNTIWENTLPNVIAAGPVDAVGQTRRGDYHLKTMVYKDIDGVQIHADVYVPKEPNSLPMPIDVCDAYIWARTVLPRILIASEISRQVDSERVVAIGWSTGGHLAMSLGWMAEAAGYPAPNAVLSFYAPTDFESGGPFLTTEQITNSSSAGDTSDLGWVRQGDPRSDLLLAISQQGIALPVLLNGLTGDRKLADLLTPPSPATVASISPLARLRAGQYAVPTFIVHGTEDEVAPFAGAERFADEMRRQAPGTRCELLALPGVRHLFDLGLEQGSPQWEQLVEPGYRFLCEVLRTD
ncbi:Type I Iterative PKS [Diaporthe eres]|uniref:Type I Iterative PKS n=1 Tax=Diaporthe eres TaxID=83184 RepID=A0ABR1NXA2_DIAER